MKGLFKRTTTTDGRSPKASLGSRVTLAAFGKHPGWDDHMPGIGVDTELLAHLKQALYVRGIGKQIDSGKSLTRINAWKGSTTPSSW